MKIYDCFMFFDEEMLLDLRLNIMNKYVDKFVITEARYMHSGRSKKLVFDINKYKKFREKIVYNVIDEQPPGITPVYEDDDKTTRGTKLINNSSKREHYQRELLKKSLNELEPDDFIIISDIDEIPNLEKINFNKIKKKLVLFKQKMFYYKFNLLYEKMSWFGSKACRKKNFISPQWLRDVKSKKYPIWRLDILFSNNKYHDIYYVENGGWHFTNIRSPEDIEKKFLNFLHHQDFEESGLKLNDIQQMVKMKKVLYDHTADQKDFKWGGNSILKNTSLSNLPDYLCQNYEKYKDWLA